MLADDPEIQTLVSLLQESRRVAVFTGAGISTESGIPDFRSPGGMWSRHTPVQFDDFVRSEAARREAWRQKLESSRDMTHAEPNRGHRAVEKLVRDGKVQWVITQNIDGLHQRSGVPPEQIIELHGNGTYAACLRCGRRHELEPILKSFELSGALPLCEHCGGLVKTATVSFGQAMPEQEMERAQQAAEDCDLFIAIGSSLVVWPAAGFPVHAKRRGARLVILNREPTDLDGMADLVLNREIGPTLGFAVNVN
jgi:NAD-dependent deacetylase